MIFLVFLSTKTKLFLLWRNVSIEKKPGRCCNKQRQWAPEIEKCGKVCMVHTTLHTEKVLQSQHFFVRHRLKWLKKRYLFSRSEWKHRKLGLSNHGHEVDWDFNSELTGMIKLWAKIQNLGQLSQVLNVSSEMKKILVKV